MGADGDDGGDGEHTQAYYVIKAEREIRALEKTLSHLFSKNAGYKQTFAPVERGSAQLEQKLLLEEQHRAALSKYRSSRIEQSELEEEMERLQQRVGELSEEKEGASQQLMALSDHSGALHDGIQQQGERLERASAPPSRSSWPTSRGTRPTRRWWRVSLSSRVP